jgi:hypothetical protein
LKPPDKRTVLLETVVALAAYGPGLGVVTVVDGALPAVTSIFAGVLVSGVAYTVSFYALFDRLPEFLGRRPWRYSLPNAIGLSAATAVSWLALDAATTFALAIPLLIVGQTVSQLWWSAASRRDVASAPA